MIAKFKGVSEYMKEFREPKRSHRNPDLEPFAGLNTPNLAMTEEPFLQKKKKLDGVSISGAGLEPPIQRKKRSESSSPIRHVMEPELQRKKKPHPYKKTAPIVTEFSSPGHPYDDYMLLGDQSKFNDNVRYRVRSKSAHERSPERRPKSSSENVPHHHHTPSHHHHHHHHHSGGNHGDHNGNVERPPVTHVTNHSERKSRSRERGPPPLVVVDTGKPNRAERSRNGHEEQHRLANDRKALERSDHDHRKGILRKSVATQSAQKLTNGVDSSDVIDENPHKSDERKKASSSVSVPSEAAKSSHNSLKTGGHHNDIVVEKKIQRDEKSNYASSKPSLVEREPNRAIKYRLGIAPHLSNGPVRFSEYQREYRWRDPTKSSPLINAETVVYKSHPDLTLFRSSSMADDSEYRAQFKAWAPSKAKDKENHIEYNHREQPNRAKIRRSKSLKELPTQLKPTVPTVAAADPGVRGHSEDEGYEHRKLVGQTRKKYRSEYSSNFLAPWNYLYEEGAWKKLHAKEEVKEEKQHPLSAASWYAEVLELRRFADEYRKRAQGTHFSREHLAQLFAKNAELWDTASTGSTLLSNRPAEEQERSDPTTLSMKKPTLMKTLSKPGTKPNLSLPVDESAVSSRSVSSIGSLSPPAENKENAFPVPTKRPTVNKIQHATQSAPQIHSQRYQARLADDSSDNDYEDSLEPVSRRAISNGHTRESRRSTVNEKSQGGISTKSLNGKITKQSKTSEGSRGHAPVTTITSHGMPTKDSHVLVDSNNQFDDGEPWADKIPAHSHYEDKAIQMDDDVMSVASFRSLASSSSLASEVLERARTRRSDFWK